MKKRLSMLAAALCAVLMVGSLSVTAYAGGGDEYIEPTEQWEGLDPVAEKMCIRDRDKMSQSPPDCT